MKKLELMLNVLFGDVVRSMETEGNSIIINEKYEVSLNRSAFATSRYSVKEVGTWNSKGFNDLDSLTDYISDII